MLCRRYTGKRSSPSDRFHFGRGSSSASESQPGRVNASESNLYRHYTTNTTRFIADCKPRVVEAVTESGILHCIRDFQFDLLTCTIDNRNVVFRIPQRGHSVRTATDGGPTLNHWMPVAGPLLLNAMSHNIVCSLIHNRFKASRRPLTPPWYINHAN